MLGVYREHVKSQDTIASSITTVVFSIFEPASKKICRNLNWMVPRYEFNLHYDSNDNM